MQIIGRGFLAQNLAEAFGDRHPHVVAQAAGVSSTSVTAAADFDREAELLYQSLRQCRAEGSTLLFFSTASFAMYGSTTIAATEDGPLCPPSVYGRHKLALESSVRSSGVDHLILRLGHLAGPYQRAHQLLPGLAAQIGTGTVTVQKGAHRDVLDVRDLVRAVDALLIRRVPAQIVNVVSGIPQPVELVVDGIERRLGVTAERVYVPTPVSRTLVSVEKLARLAPELAAERPGSDYLDRLLDRYLPLALTR